MKIKNQTINGGNQQFADKIVNQNKNINAGNYVEGNVSNSNLSERDIHITNNNSSADNFPKIDQKTILVAAASPDNKARLRLDIEAA
jgi:hypothetical protein